MSIGDVVALAATLLAMVALCWIVVRTVRIVHSRAFLPLFAGGLVTIVVALAIPAPRILTVPLGLIGLIALVAVIGEPARRARRLQRDVEWQRSLAEMRARQVTYVSHEIRTPLSLIRASIELLIERLGETVDVREHELMEVVRRNTDSVVTIVQRNLEDARAEATLFSPNLSSTDIRRLLTITLDELRRISDVPILMKSGGPPQRLMIDQSLIHQVILNIVGNAIQPGRQASEVWVKLLQSDEGATISVSDDGKGMTAEQRRSLFEPFHSDNVAEGGVGVGLAISKQIVELHGGRILVDTMVARGTTIIITLPAGGEETR
jgi:signal transduction histidine kinase